LRRVDLCDRLPDVPGGFGAAHFHPEFAGNEPCPRTFDPELTANPWRWLRDQVANLGAGAGGKAWQPEPAGAGELSGLADTDVTLGREPGLHCRRPAPESSKLPRDGLLSGRGLS